MTAKVHPVKSDPFVDAKCVGVLGAGVSGLAAAGLLAEQDKSVVLIDDGSPRDAEKVAALRERGIEVAVDLGGQVPAQMEKIEGLVTSPGIPATHGVIAEAKRRGLPVIGELELAWIHSGPARTVAITGTNGKTTTTMLVRELAAAGGFNAVQTGNIGHAFCDAVREEAGRLEQTVFVAEVSSFQLEEVVQFSPDVALILNITPDHLDRHKTMLEYAAAKARITAAQTPGQVLVVNHDDAECLRVGHGSQARLMTFSTRHVVDEGAWLDEDRLVISLRGGKPKRLTDLDRLRLPGMHNVENYLAGACAAAALGIDRKTIGEALERFEGAPHRLQYIGRIDGADYFNDSKATNVDAMVKAVESFTQPIHLIAGGRDKDSPFASIVPKLAGRVVRAYLIGEAADKIERAWSGRIETLQCGRLAVALDEARSRAGRGDVVLLSPGCASFDQYRSYAERGEEFNAWVRERAEPENPEAQIEGSGL